VRREVLWALGGCQPLPAEVIPHLLDRMKDRATAVANIAVQVLCQSDPPPPELLTRLRQQLHHRSEERRIDAVVALADLNYQPDDDDLPPLSAALQSPDSAVAYGAAEMLARAGPAVVPVLVEHLDAVEELTRCCAAHALGILGPGAAAAVPALAPLLHSLDAQTRCRAMQAVAQIGTPEALAQLRPCLRENSPAVRGALMEGCGKIGAAALPLLPEILELVRLEDDFAAAAQVQQVLVGLAAHSPDVVAGLRALLGDPEVEVCYRAILVLGGIGPQAEAARADLEGLLHHPQERVRSNAARALAKVAAVP
jgi:HEAT repeat protein